MSPVPLILNTHKQPCKQGSFYTQAALQTRQLLHTKSRSIKAAFTHKKPFKQGSFYRQEAFQTRQPLHTSSHDSKWKWWRGSSTGSLLFEAPSTGVVACSYKIGIWPMKQRCKLYSKTELNGSMKMDLTNEQLGLSKIDHNSTIGYTWDLTITFPMDPNTVWEGTAHPLVIIPQSLDP